MLKIVNIIIFIVLQLQLLADTKINLSTEPKWKNKQISIKECLTIGEESFIDERYSFANILDIAVSNHGNIIIIDSRTVRVLKYSKSGKFLCYIGKGKGEGPGEFRRPWIVTVDNKENIYIADHGSSLVLIFNDRGDYIKSFRTLYNPQSIAADSKGNVYLGYWSSRHGGAFIYKYDNNGKLLAKFCSPNNAKIAAVVEETGNSGALSLTPDGNLVYSFHYPYDTRIYSTDGKLHRRFARENKSYEPPKWNKQCNCMESRSGCRAVKVMPDGKIVNLIFTMNRHNKDQYDYFFDIFNPDGDWLVSIPASHFKINLMRTFAFDNEGYIYIIYYEPFPHLKKFLLRFN